MKDLVRWSASFQVVLFLSIFAGPGRTAAEGAMTVGETRCEYALNPIGIDTLNPRLNWTLLDDQRGQRQSAYEIRVAGTSDGLENPSGLSWDSGKVVSDQNTGIVYAGNALQSGSRCYWQVRAWDKDGQPTPWSAPAFWQVALLAASDWKASWIGLPKDAEAPDGQNLKNPVLPEDCPRLRKDFVLENKPIRRATVSVCGLGFYELYINGEKTDDQVLAPADTAYAKRLLYDTIDVTAKVKPGPNALGLWLAPGYSDDYTKYQLSWAWLHPKRAILQLDVVFADGTTATIVSDGSWRAGKSPITYASLYNGEVYDARLETPGWATAGFADQDWKPVAVLTPVGGSLKPNIEPPVRVTQTIRPVNMTEPKPGVFVFDLGQNFVGWCRLSATGPSGTSIVLRYSELTSPDGMIDPWTNRHAKNTDTFVLKGDGPETYEPRFTYHGFRYVEVTGYPGRPTLDNVTGCVVEADVKPAGTFVSSDKVLNQIDSNTSWTMRSNFKSFPTACAQRDERTACAMDVLAYEDSAFYHFWVDPFYTKWMNDISGDFLTDPHPVRSGEMVFLPWQLYWQYGDRRVLEDHYADMAAYVDFLRAKTPDDIYTKGFGDWDPPNKGSWASFFGNVTDVDTSFYAAIVRIVSQAAAVLGKTDDATRYGQLADEITRTYNEKRFNATTAAYGDGSQTTAIVPLALGLVPPGQRAAVFAHMLATIRGKDKGHLDTGIFGTRYLVDVLSDFGEPDLAISMLTRPDYPSFGNQIAQGATTVWEQWSFKGGMDSHNHVMFSGVSSSFYSRFAGITPLQPGYAQIGIRPVMPKSLSFVEASLKTVKGTVSVKWQRDGGKIVIEASIPVNTTARVAVPAVNAQAVTESGKPADQAEDVTFAGMENGCAVFTVGSGTYQFAASDLTSEKLN